MSLLTLGVYSCKQASKKKHPPHVVVAKVAQRDVPIYVDAIGQSISPVSVDIKPQVTGKLISTYIQQGDIVKKGDIIYQIDPRPYQAVLEEAKAQLEHDLALLEYAEKTVASYKPIVDEDFIAVLTFEGYLSNAAAARAQVELDRAAITAAQINVEFCDIVAPISGKISYFVIDVGNVLILENPTAITTIKPFDPIDILFSLPQQQLEMIRAVQGNEGKWKFTVVLPEHPDKKIEGTTYFIDNQVNQNTGTILMKGKLNNENWEFWPGEFVKVQVLHRIAPNAFVVPPGGVLIGKDGPYIYTVDSEQMTSVHNVKVLIRTDEYIAFDASDVCEGDTIVIEGQLNIAPGMKVKTSEVGK